MKIRLEIELDAQTGSFIVNGPFDNLGVCYQLLEMAKDVCRGEAQKRKLGVLAAQPADIEKLSKH